MVVTVSRLSQDSTGYAEIRLVELKRANSGLKLTTFSSTEPTSAKKTVESACRLANKKRTRAWKPKGKTIFQTVFLYVGYSNVSYLNELLERNLL